MEFFTFSNEKRPVRLSASTRTFAEESLQHKYGQDTRAVAAAVLDNIENFETLSPLEKYNVCITEIAKQGRVRICAGERLSGAATFGEAIHHWVPATYHGNIVFPSVSHLTVDFGTVLAIGMDGIEEKIKARLTDAALNEKQKAFLHSACCCVDAMRLWHSRYLLALQSMPDYADNYRNLCRVPFSPPTSFHEAVQSIWFTFAFLRLCGNWPGIGRLDVLLEKYLQNDLQSGRITIEEAREILAHFFIKGCEWVSGGVYGSGDSQHYQNIVLGGIGEDGREVTGEVTYLVLDILEEFNIGDFPTTIRLHQSSPEKLLRRTAEVIKHGGGAVAVYNEEVVISAMTKAGYSLAEARKFANDGCWETQVPGKTYFNYAPFDALRILLDDTLHIKEGGVSFADYAQLRDAYFANMDTVLQKIHDRYTDLRIKRVSANDWHFKEQTPCTVVSLFEEGCIQSATSYLESGALYSVVSPHIGGAADVGNSLRVIDKLCFREKILPLAEFLQILQNNWEGSEPLRQYVLNKIPCYGNDDDEADGYTVDVVNTFADLVEKYNSPMPFLFVPGVSTFGRQIEWAPARCATPHGHKAGEVLAPNMGATPGSDVRGATALIASYCKIDLERQTTGAALDLKLLPSAVKGEEGTNALMALMRGFVRLGGYFMQPDVIDNAVLLEAQKHPEQYASLSVRVSGWNARFVTLSKQWQDMCIQKTTHGEM